MKKEKFIPSKTIVFPTHGKEIIEKFQKEGYICLFNGAPDFIFYKINEDGNIIPESIIFYEYKRVTTRSKNQRIWGDILKKLGLKYAYGCNFNFKEIKILTYIKEYK